MATDEIKLNYGLAEEMAKTFQQGAEQLQDTMQAMQSVANTLEEGALLGKGGSAFVTAIRSNLCPALGRLTDKFTELEEDVYSAIDSMKQADAKAKGMF